MVMLELILEKECGLQPGTDLHLVKVEGKKIIVEVRDILNKRSADSSIDMPEWLDDLRKIIGDDAIDIAKSHPATRDEIYREVL